MCDRLFEKLTMLNLDKLSFNEVPNINKFIDLSNKYDFFPKRLYIKHLFLAQNDTDFEYLCDYFARVNFLTGKVK